MGEEDTQVLSAEEIKEMIKKVPEEEDQAQQDEED